MDTGSHLLFGVSLAGLAYMDPAVAGNSALAYAVAVGTIVGSNAPDFDLVVRLKGMASYLRHHRGITHSLPALPLWPALLALPLAFGFGVTEYLLHLYGWMLVAVLFHVLLDALNSY
ncbi:metal-dependent hydrolase, partial [Microbacteriaceae bacterium K1510]|nr:metal-dependent hydrolase [Microbacteriaceae bacterium K1510]